MKIKNEHLFMRFCPYDCAPSDAGRMQFFMHQSKGIKPELPDPYYTALDDGKCSFDNQCRSMQQSWLNGDGIHWHGLLQTNLDWKKERWVLKYLLKWHPRSSRYARYKDPKNC